MAYLVIILKAFFFRYYRFVCLYNVIDYAVIIDTLWCSQQNNDFDSNLELHMKSVPDQNITMNNFQQAKF